MSQIQPNSTIYLLKGIPLEKDGQHTIFWGVMGGGNSPRATQANWFSNAARVKRALTTYTYQRSNKNAIRVGLPVEQVIDCNYMMFKNTNFENKWFYAFITEPPKYINNNTTELVYEIDPLQTWLPTIDYSFEQCFVVREHISPNDDKVGANLEPEPVEPGEYVFENYGKLTDYQNYAVIISIVDTSVHPSVGGTIYDNVYSGAVLFAFDEYDYASVQGKIERYVADSNAILALYVVPRKLIDLTPLLDSQPIPTGGVLLTTGACGRITKYALPVLISNPGTGQTATKIGNYTPKNKKLYTYPYHFISMDNANGDCLSLRYEFFEHDNAWNYSPYATVYGTLTMPVKAVAYPNSYKGVHTGTQPSSDYKDNLRTEFLTLDNFPLGSWSNDYYQAYIAQNAVSEAVNFGKNLSVASALSPAAAATFSSKTFSGEAASLIGNIYKSSIHADIIGGNLKSGSVTWNHGFHNFYVGRAHVTEERAKVIDDFFTRFGYATNRLKTPGIANRSDYNYVETRGCEIKGSSNLQRTYGIPNDDMKEICRMMDRGLTWWQDPNNVGAYT